MSYTPQTTFVNGISPWGKPRTKDDAYELVGAYVQKSKHKTPVQDAVLAWLAANPHSTLEDISRAFGTSLANANSTIWRMLQYHLVARTQKPGSPRTCYMYKVAR